MLLTLLTVWPSPGIPQYKCPQYGKISNLILVILNITHAIYVLNFLHVERWHIFEVFNHIYNVIFKYNVIYYIGRIIKTKCLLQIEQPMMCTKTPEMVRVVREIKVIIKAYIYIYGEHLARIICKAPVWYLCHYI